MIGNLRPFVSYAPVALGILACGIASAADGSSHQSKATALTPQQSALTATTSNEPSVPVDAPPKPPQAAFDACKSASEGDACSVSFDGHTMSGTCRKGPNDEAELACAPAHPPGPPPSGSRTDTNAGNSSRQNSVISSSALEHQLDQLERQITGT